MPTNNLRFYLLHLVPERFYVLLIGQVRCLEGLKLLEQTVLLLKTPASKIDFLIAAENSLLGICIGSGRLFKGISTRTTKQGSSTATTRKHVGSALNRPGPTITGRHHAAGDGEVEPLEVLSRRDSGHYS